MYPVIKAVQSRSIQLFFSFNFSENVLFVRMKAKKFHVRFKKNTQLTMFVHVAIHSNHLSV